MRYEDLTAEDQELVNTDFGDFDKEASEKLAEANEVYTYGQEQAHAIADQMDEVMAKFASDDEDEDDKEEELDEESEKKAAELGSFIERGLFDELTKLGSERHGDAMYYYYPYMEEKVAQIGAEEKVAALKDVWNATKAMAGKAKDRVVTESGKVRARATSAKDTVKSLGTPEGRAAAKDYAKKVPGRAWEATKAAPGKAKASAGKGYDNFKDYHTGIASDMKAEGLKGWEKAKSRGKGSAKMIPHAAGLGLAGYGGKKLYENKKK